MGAESNDHGISYETRQPTQIRHQDRTNHDAHDPAPWTDQLRRCYTLRDVRFDCFIDIYFRGFLAMRFLSRNNDTISPYTRAVEETHSQRVPASSEERQSLLYHRLHGHQNRITVELAGKRGHLQRLLLIQWRLVESDAPAVGHDSTGTHQASTWLPYRPVECSCGCPMCFRGRSAPFETHAV